MRKKITVITVVILTVTFLITGCASTIVNTDMFEVLEQDEMLIVVEQGSNYTVYADKDTGVMYLWVMGPWKGGLTVLLNADGTPKIWQREELNK